MEAEGIMTDTQRFDREAATWDEDAGRAALARAVAGAIAAQVPLSPSIDALDFGCGTGLLSLAIQPLVHSVTGADTSAGMLDVFVQKVAALGLESVKAYRLDEEKPLLAAGTFDLITSSMALHHVRDLPALFSQFIAMLRPGGHVALADLDREDGTFHSADVTDVHHLGFDRQELRALLAEAGFDGIRDSTAFVHRRHGRQYPVFLISGRVPPADEGTLRPASCG
jgi:tRNA (cmo5U34)-methyltransferase